jgi:hypothetical protein
MLCQGIAACALWVSGLQLLQSVALAQTSPDAQAEKTSKAKKAKKSATDAASKDAAAPTGAEEKTSKAKKAKKSAADATSTQPATTTEEKAPKARKSKKSTDTTSTGSANRAQTSGEKPAPVRNASGAEISSARASGKVWVNTDSGVYHKGGQWYGATKQGKFMTEQEAAKAGYRAAKNEK